MLVLTVDCWVSFIGPFSALKSSNPGRTCALCSPSPLPTSGLITALSLPMFSAQLISCAWTSANVPRNPHMKSQAYTGSAVPSAGAGSRAPCSAASPAPCELSASFRARKSSGSPAGGWALNACEIGEPSERPIKEVGVLPSTGCNLANMSSKSEMRAVKAASKSGAV